MFVSFLLPAIFEGERVPHLLVFYKLLAEFGRDQIAFIGEPSYFRAPAAFAAEGRPEWSSTLRERYEFEPPRDLEGVIYEALPDNLFAKRLARELSNLRVYGQLMQQRVPELETALAAALDRLQSRDQVEAIITFVNMPSVSRVARDRNLPLIQCEYGPLRKPAYHMTAYWDRRGSSSLGDARRRFRTFVREVAHQPLTLLDRDELLHTLRRTAPPAAVESDVQYRAGVALQGDDHSYAQAIRPLDLLSVASRHFKPYEILIRHHPAALTRFSERLGAIDSSETATEFISKCESVVTVSSGTTLEALLLGRRCVVLGDSAFALAADRSFATASRRSAREQLLALNFLVFGYIVPLELVFDPEYTRWRLGEPTEIEIVRHHQRWYRNRLMPVSADNVAVTMSTATKLLGAMSQNKGVRVGVFGSGRSTSDLITYLRSTRFEPTVVFDNDPTKWGDRVEDLPIEPPAYHSDAAVVVASLTHADEMVSQLQALGYPDERIVRLLPQAA